MTSSDFPEDPRDARAIVDYWRAAGPKKWFAKDAAFDDELRTRFVALHEQAAAGQLEDWARSAVGALALMILLDQFPRNAFRGSPRMFATDALAKSYAERALSAGFDEQAEPELRMFFYLPFMHSENLADQERCVRLYQGSPYLSYAEQHRDVIARFGRFPHRNPILGRTMTPDEQAYLDAGGFAG